MTRILSVLFVFALSGCAGDFATQCDGISDADEQLACLDAGFQSLRTDQAVCRGDDVRERQDDCYAVCAERGGEEECRRACYEDDRGDETRDAPRDETRSRRADDARGEDERERLDRLHLDTRDDVRESDRTRDRSRHIRRGLRDGEDLARCEER